MGIRLLRWPARFITLVRLSEYGFDHIKRNAPVLVRSPKLTRFEPAQYWGGGPPGNSVVLNPFFCFQSQAHARGLDKKSKMCLDRGSNRDL